MTEDLYFIPIVAAAMRQPDRKSAVRRAFIEIAEMGTRTAFRQGLRQFQRFMMVVGEACAIEVIVERDGIRIGDAAIGPVAPAVCLAGITPGLYAIRMSTGRVIWEGMLSEADLVWEIAFRGEPLPLAAATRTNARRCSRKEILLGGPLVLYVCPGVETGDMVLDLAQDR